MTDEMRLLIALCAPHPDAALVAELVARPIDTRAFGRLAGRHRVGALAWRGLAASKVRAPDAVARALAADARTTARRGQALALETARLSTALDAAGVACVVLKGAPLAVLAHGTVAAKYARDIDLLVAPDRLDPAAATLERAGYRRSGPDAARVALADWHRFAKDSAWHHPASETAVELHTELTDHPRFLLPGVGVDSACRSVELVPGATVRTFATEPLFAYLCVHGALSGWHRLKWLADLVGLLRDCDASGIARLHAAAEALGAGRAATQGVALAAALFGTPLPAGVAAAMRADWRNRALVAGARRLLSEPEGAGVLERPFGTARIHAMTALLVPTRGYRRSLLRRYLRADPCGPRGVPFPLARAARRLAGKATD